MNKLKYIIKKTDARTMAKNVEFINPVLDKKHLFPSVMFDVRQKEELEAVIQAFSRGNDFERIFGLQIPYYKILKYMPILLKKVSKKLSFISDINSEVFYYGSIKEEKKNFYLSHKLIPEKIKSEIIVIQKKKGCGSKAKMHFSLWNNIISDKRLLLNLITEYVNRQMAYQFDFITVPSPLILNKEHLSIVEVCYNQAMRLYHGALVDIEEEQGRVLTLYLNLHKTFLNNENNLKELYALISRVKPKAIAIKLNDVGDVRQMTSKAKDMWKNLMKNLGILSHEQEIPVFYLSTSTEGLVSQAYGIDCFTQMFNKTDNMEKEIKGFDKEFSRKSWQLNPKLSSGKIVLYEEKDFVDRIAFEKSIEKNGTIPYPIKQSPGIDIERIKGMSPNTFRQFSKLMLILVRNLEVKENANAIENSEISTLKNRYKTWFTDHKLFPS